MTDALPPEPLIDAGHVKIREALVRDQLRIAGLRHKLPCDWLFVRGELTRDGWGSLHRFRGDVLEFGKLRGGRGPSRGPLPADARPRKPTGYSMASIPVERVLGCRKLMTGGLYEVALILVGEAQGEVETSEAQRAAWELTQIYTGDAGTARWRDWG